MVNKLNGYVHVCDEHRVDISNYRALQNNICFSDADWKLITDFYLINTPTMDKNNSGYKFYEYGWVSEEDEGILQSLLMSNFRQGQFCFLNSNSLTKIGDALELRGSEICINHSRGVILVNYETSIKSTGELDFKLLESNSAALFRHVRNSLAHGNFYLFENENVLLRDKKGNLETAHIVMPASNLLEWRNIF